MEKIKTPEKKLDLKKIADELEALQKVKNSGRGVGCVQTVIVYLRLGDLSSAKAVCWNEADKIESYPDIKGYLQKELFDEGRDPEAPPHFQKDFWKKFNKDND